MKTNQILISKFYHTILEYFQNPLYRNSLFLSVGRFADVGFGFLFWIIAAKIYTIGNVGIATALISSLGLVIVFSRFGFDTSIIRYMPSYDKKRVFNSCLWITTITTVIICIIYVLLIDYISPELNFIKNFTGIFILIAIFNSVAVITGNAFISFRNADLRLIQNLIMGIRLPLLFPLVIIGSLGIFFSLGLAYLIGSIFAFVMIRKFIQISLHIDWKFMQEVFHFSFMNYLISIFHTVPILIMPIIILNLISSENAAIYYIAFAIGNLILIIPDAISTSFFVEGCYGANLRDGALRALIITYVILIPLVIFVFFYGEILLGFFGSEYKTALDLLRLIAISSLFVTIYHIFIQIQNIRLHTSILVLITMLRFILLISLSYIFLLWFGIIGAGYAWLLTYVIIGMGILVFARNEKWI